MDYDIVQDSCRLGEVDWEEAQVERVPLHGLEVLVFQQELALVLQLVLVPCKNQFAITVNNNILREVELLKLFPRRDYL